MCGATGAGVQRASHRPEPSWAHDSRLSGNLCVSEIASEYIPLTGGVALRGVTLCSQVPGAHVCILISPFCTLQLPRAGAWALLRLCNIDFPLKGLRFYAPLSNKRSDALIVMADSGQEAAETVTGTRIWLSPLIWISKGAGPQTIEGTLPDNPPHSSTDPAGTHGHRQTQHRA